MPKCPQCRKEFATPSGVGAHLRNVHGITGGLSGKSRSRNTAVVPVPTVAELTGIDPTYGKARGNGPSRRFKATDHVVLVDQDGRYWLAEPIPER